MLPIYKLLANSQAFCQQFDYSRVRSAFRLGERSLKDQNEPYQVVFNQRRNKQEIEECVVFARLELYNRAMPCGQKRFKKN
jgi:hypothetical protein